MLTAQLACQLARQGRFAIGGQTALSDAQSFACGSTSSNTYEGDNFDVS